MQRFWRVMAADSREALFSVGKTHFHQHAAQVGLFLQNLPQAIRGSRVAAISDRARFRFYDKRCRFDRMSHEDRANVAPGDLQGFFRVEFHVTNRRVLRRGNNREIRPKFVVEEVFLQNADRFTCTCNQQRRRRNLAPIVRERREIADVIEVRVTDETRFELELLGDFKATRERSCIDGESFVEDERARPMPRSFAAVTTNDAQIHVVSLPRQSCAAFRETQRNLEVVPRQLRRYRLELP